MKEIIEEPSQLILHSKAGTLSASPLGIPFGRLVHNATEWPTEVAKCENLTKDVAEHSIWVKNLRNARRHSGLACCPWAHALLFLFKSYVGLRHSPNLTLVHFSWPFWSAVVKTTHGDLKCRRYYTSYCTFPAPSSGDLSHGRNTLLAGTTKRTVRIQKIRWGGGAGSLFIEQKGWGNG